MRGIVVCLIVVLAGCTLRASKQPAIPPAPQPDPAATQAAEVTLSIPQTSAHLPSPQELNPAAIPPEQAPQHPGETEKAEAPPPKNAPPRTPGPRVKPVETTGTPSESAESVPTEPVAAPAASAPAPFQPIISSEQQTQLKNAIAQRKREIANLLTKAGEHGGNDQKLIDLIRSFLKLSEEADQRSDYTQADALSQRALNLAQDLKIE
jgi:hypothetical protein